MDLASRPRDIQRADRGSPRWRCRLRVKTVILSTLDRVLLSPPLDLHPRLIFLGLIRFFESIFELEISFREFQVMLFRNQSIIFKESLLQCFSLLIASFGNMSYVSYFVIEFSL